MALTQKGDVRSAPDRADVRNPSEKQCWIQLAPLGQGRPELQAAFEVLIDLQGFGDGDRSISRLRCVVELAVGGMTGTCIVGGGGALEGRALEPLNHQQPQVGIELMQQSRQRGTHDSSAHEHCVVTAAGVKRAVVLHRNLE